MDICVLFYDIFALVGSWSSVSIRNIIYNCFYTCLCDIGNTSIAAGGKVKQPLTINWVVVVLQLAVLSLYAIVV